MIDNQGNTEEMKHVEYNGFTAILIEAVKEQQKMIEDLQKEVELLKQNKLLEERIFRLESKIND